jgi:hypothetical protein
MREGLEVFRRMWRKAGDSRSKSLLRQVASRISRASQPTTLAPPQIRLRHDGVVQRNQDGLASAFSESIPEDFDMA